MVAVGNWVYSPASLPLELDVYDRMMNSVEVTPSREVAIVAIDDASLAQLGEWPWPRDVHASLIDKLKARRRARRRIHRSIRHRSPYQRA